MLEKAYSNHYLIAKTRKADLGKLLLVFFGLFGKKLESLTNALLKKVKELNEKLKDKGLQIVDIKVYNEAEEKVYAPIRLRVGEITKEGVKIKKEIGLVLDEVDGVIGFKETNND